MRTMSHRQPSQASGGEPGHKASLLLSLRHSPSPTHCLQLLIPCLSDQTSKCPAWIMLLGCILKSLRGQTPPLGEAPPSQAFPSCPWLSGQTLLPVTHICRRLSLRKWAHHSFPNEVSGSVRSRRPSSEFLTHSPPRTLTPKQKSGSRKDPVSRPSTQGCGISDLSQCSLFLSCSPSLSLSLPPFPSLPLLLSKHILLELRTSQSESYWNGHRSLA